LQHQSASNFATVYVLEQLDALVMLSTRRVLRMKRGNGLYNVAIIGAGTAGLVAAAGTAGLGGRVALIERNQMGGDCLNFGCVPSKALISAARLIQQNRESEKWGLDRQEPRLFSRKSLSECARGARNSRRRIRKSASSHWGSMFSAAKRNLFRRTKSKSMAKTFARRISSLLLAGVPRSRKSMGSTKSHISPMKQSSMTWAKNLRA
jgi:choline dehydrogenase-like flavoprotein